MTRSALVRAEQILDGNLDSTAIRIAPECQTAWRSLLRRYLLIRLIRKRGRSEWKPKGGLLRAKGRHPEWGTTSLTILECGTVCELALAELKLDSIQLMRQASKENGEDRKGLFLWRELEYLQQQRDWRWIEELFPGLAESDVAGPERISRSISKTRSMLCKSHGIARIILHLSPPVLILYTASNEIDSGSTRKLSDETVSPRVTRQLTKNPGYGLHCEIILDAHLEKYRRFQIGTRVGRPKTLIAHGKQRVRFSEMKCPSGEQIFDWMVENRKNKKAQLEFRNGQVV